MRKLMSNAAKYKVVPDDYTNQSKAKREKKNIIRVNDYDSRLYDSKIWSRKRTIRYV